MFFTPTLDSNWFIIQKASQYLMILLLVFALFIPLLYTPQEAEAELLAIAVGTLIISGAAVVVTIWIYNDGRCDYCNDGRETDHLDSCDNCPVKSYQCPRYPYSSHQSICYHCGDILYSCGGDNDNEEIWAPHGSQSCNYCPDEYIPCKEADEHGDGVCNYNSSSGNSNSG